MPEKLSNSTFPHSEIFVGFFLSRISGVGRIWGFLVCISSVGWIFQFYWLWSFRCSLIQILMNLGVSLVLIRGVGCFFRISVNQLYFPNNEMLQGMFSYIPKKLILWVQIYFMMTLVSNRESFDLRPEWQIWFRSRRFASLNEKNKIIIAINLSYYKLSNILIILISDLCSPSIPSHYHARNTALVSPAR